MATPPEDLLRIQRRFAGHIRDPQGVAAPPELEARRMAIYRRLVFNNIFRLMASNFPVVKRLYSDQAWQDLIAGFLRAHRAETPLFPEIAQELVRYLYRLQAQDALTLPFVADLAHWEATETRVRLHPADLDGIEFGNEMLSERACPLLNPTLCVEQYAWPVHLIGPRYQPASPPEQSVILLAYRKRDDSVAFKQINALTAGLIGSIKARPEASLGEHLDWIAEQLGQADHNSVIEQGRLLIQNLHQSEVIMRLGPMATQQTTLRKSK